MPVRSLVHPLSLGSVVLESNILMAPMAGYTDRVFRSLAIAGGASLCWTEMISAEALIRRNDRTMRMMRRAEGETTLAVQLFGSNPEILGKAASTAVEFGADLLDLNAGCPVPKVVKTGAGSALMRDPNRLKEAVQAIGEAGVPVTAKIRSGWDDSERNWMACAQVVWDAGAVALGFHGRTRKQGYGGRSDWEALKLLSTESPIPVIGSGDLVSPQAAEAMLKKTGCAGVMFARGAVGDPGIGGRTRSYLSGSPISEPTRQDRLAMARRHLEKAARAFGEETTVKEIKKHLAGYARNWTGSSELRHLLVRCRSIREMDEILAESL